MNDEASPRTSPVTGMASDIRDRRFRAIVESAVDFAIMAMDNDGRVTEWNTGAERILGWSAEEMLGELVNRFFTPDDQAEGRPAVEMRCALETGRANDERWHLRRDGSAFWASGEMMPLRDEDGSHLGFIKILRDRTEQKRAQQALHDSEQRLHLAQNAGGVGVWHWVPATNEVHFSDEMHRIYGLLPDTMRTYEQWLALVHPDDRGPMVAKRDAAIHAQKPFELEFRVTRADGSKHWIHAKGQAEYGEGGEVTRVLGVNIDITKRKAIEATLLLQEGEFKTLADNIPTLCWMARADGHIHWYNQRWYEYTGTDPEEQEGWGWETVHDPDILPQVAERWRYSLATGEPFEMVFPLKRADGVFRPFLTRVMPIRSEPDGPILRWFGTNTDITRQHDAEQALRALNETLEQRVAAEVSERAKAEEQLRQSQKMEAVGQLTGGLAHDFNNLLTGITGSLELLQTRIAQGRVHDVERYVNAAQGAAKRAAALTHRLLAFSRRQTLDPKPVNINRLIAGMEELIRRTVGPAITVEAVAAGGLWSTLIDPGQLENALLNLCINARDAMSGVGRLTIETGNRWLDQRAARERDLAPGQYVSLCVSDTGCGMEPNVIERAFDPFFTTKPIGMGTGLGLSMVYGFARQSGGQARIYSEPGHGAMVCLYLPHHRGEAGEVEDQIDPAKPPNLAEQGKTVLVVDDEPTVRMLVTEVLEELGCTTIEAADGAAGLKVLQSDVHLDLLVTDVGLPGGLNGRQVADAGRAVRSGLKVLFITGYAENAAVGNGHLEPGMHVLTKPFAMEVLANRVRDLLGQT